jgi:hypothetical protein
MEDFMIRRVTVLASALLVVMPALCTAQSEASRLWIVAGAASATIRGDCQTCEEDYPYRNGGGILANGGYRINPRMDVGMELFWVPMETESGTIRTTHIDAVAQFRPWQTRGFFFKGGAGIGVRSQLGRHAGAGRDQLEGAVGGDWYRVGVPNGQAGRLAIVRESGRRGARRFADRFG